MTNDMDTTEEPAPQSLWATGAQIGGRYTLLRLLGKGGMGSVWLARDDSMKEQVAIKAISESLSGKNEAVEKLREEARLTRPLSHPNVVRLHGLEEHDGAAMLVMEYLGGPTLQDFLKARRKAFAGTIPVLGYGELAWILSQVSTGLAYAHERKIVHRDLKPLNLMFSLPIEKPIEPVNSPGQQIKICDFGIARRMQGDQTHLEAATRVFSIYYCSPEQIRDERIGTASDIYSLGCILYECLAGKPPFTATGDKEGSMANIMFQHLHQPPVKIPGISTALWELIEKCLSKDYRTRPTAPELMKAAEQAAKFAVAPPSSTIPGSLKPAAPFEHSNSMNRTDTDTKRKLGTTGTLEIKHPRSMMAYLLIWFAVIAILSFVGYEWMKVAEVFDPNGSGPLSRPASVSLTKE